MRFRVLLGILLMVIAFAALFLLVIFPTMAPENPLVLNILQTVVCDPGQKADVKVQVTHDSDGTGYTPILTCIGREGERIDASGKHFGIGIISFIVPFLIGLFLTIAGAKGSSRPSPQTIWKEGSVPQEGFGTTSSRFSTSSFSSGTTFNSSPHVEVKDGVLKVDGIEIRMDGLKPEHLQLFQGQSPVIMTSSTTTAGGAVNLAGKLKELQEARDSGLISSAEYDKLRQEILDKLV